MKLFLVLVHAALFTLAVVLLAIPESRSETTHLMLGALLVIDGGHAMWTLHKAGLLVKTTPSGLYQAYQARPGARPAVDLLGGAATFTGVVALFMTSF